MKLLNQAFTRLGKAILERQHVEVTSPLGISERLPLQSSASKHYLATKMELQRTEQPTVRPGTSAERLGTPSFLLVSINGDSNLWRFEEPLTSISCDGQTGCPRTQVIITAPKEFSPLEAYMHFAQIKDTSSGKQPQYQKYYGNEDKFMRTVNRRFDTVHSLGVLKGMLTRAKDKRQKKQKLAMSVKIFGVSKIVAAADTVMR